MKYFSIDFTRTDGTKCNVRAYFDNIQAAIIECTKSFPSIFCNFDRILSIKELKGKNTMKGIIIQ